jgi:large subunit ribosomal protein L9
MEVILTENVSGLGREGDVVKVADGYARNFLIPKQLAVEAIEKNRRVLEHKKRQDISQDARQKKEAEKLASELVNLSCTIPMRAGETDRLFGSVTAMDIAKALNEQGFEIDRRKIELEQPIKELGAFTVPIRIHADVVANVRVLVIREEK